jgi:PAS domain S-box-containing protein
MDKGLRILLLDNAACGPELIENELARARLNCVTLCVESREEFLAALDEFRPDIILAEYTLARLSALEAMRLLRERTSDVPFLIVTASPSEEEVVECIKQGADDYILKASLRRLPSAIRNALKQRDAERERLASETAFRHSEEKFRLIAENTRDLICLLDLQFRFIYANPTHRSALGLVPENLAGKCCLELVHPDDVALLQAIGKQALQVREARTAELRFRHSNGHWLVFESVLSHTFDDQGQPQRALLVSRDITDRQSTERELRRQAAFPKFNPNPVLEFDGSGRLNYSNDAAKEMARTLDRSHPQEILPLNSGNIVKMCLSTGQSKHVQTRLNGRMLSWSFFPILGQHIVHCYAEDITERINLECQLRQVQKMESIGQLAAGVAHDFNNILTVIRGHATLMLEERGLDLALAESARQISLASERAANLTRQLLMFSRKQVLQPQLLDAKEVVNNVSKMLRTLLGEHITLRRTSEGELPPINADPVMIEQVLVNLAVNSRDAMPRGGTVTVHTSARTIEADYAERQPEARPGYFVCLSVSDTGHGMDTATLNHIFEPFFTTKEIGKGTGLGLSTVYGIVKQHRGWIEVESEVGQGTTFRVFLPASTKTAPAPDTHDLDHAPGGDETVLVVEDEASLRELVREILEKKGYRVLEAANGREALQVWQQHRDEIDLLLTDMMMPEGISGRDLAEQILSDRPNLSVLYSSGYSLDAVSHGLTLSEGENFLQKPYHPEMLARLVRKCLDRQAPVSVLAPT